MSAPNEEIKEKIDPNKLLKQMVATYLERPLLRTEHKVSELEIRFGTNPKKARPISKLDYDNVVQFLYNSGFTCDNENGLHILRIMSEYIDTKTGITKISNIRAEIVGVDLIQEYCKHNSLNKILSMTSSVSANNYKVKFTQKSTPYSEDNKPIKPVDFENHNCRISYQLEQDFMPNSGPAKPLIDKWTDNKKIFRHINRVRFTHPTLPLHADISIVKGSKKVGRVPVPQYTIQDAGVFTNIETYEVEMEVDNLRIGVGTEYNTVDKVIAIIKKGIRIVLSALQGTNYPISYNEQDMILQSYMRVLHGEQYEERRVYSSDFIGPSPLTLETKHIVANNEGTNIPNIRHNYTVTDKADGERKLLFISDNGRIYMINTNMAVIFTGTMTDEKTLFNSIIDGEHIKYDKNGNYINLYAAFDIYYVNGISVRELAFMRIAGEDEVPDNKYRLLLLLKAIGLIKQYSVLDTGLKQNESKAPGKATDKNKACDFVIKCKEFYQGTDEVSIFQGCSTILSNIKDGIYQYNTDGLIFTPCNTGVGSDRVGEAGKLKKISWGMAFKWKPVEFNTIDLLVSVRKDKNGKDLLYNIFQEGVNAEDESNLVQYKQLILRCGFSERDHGFINPMQLIIDDNLPSPDDMDDENKYKPVPFQPTSPYDPTSCFCNIKLDKSTNNDMIMKTEEGEYFEEDMIVEFKYDMAREGPWRWVPLRVRYDKTTELRNGRPNYGNAYHVANSVWKSIHSPITDDMIMKGEGIPEKISDDEVYYNKNSGDSNTEGLRNFHNLYVKKKLIVGVSERKHRLIDYAVGKAGDLPKWIDGKLGFVFGIDVSKDNIMNNMDGACTRYLKKRREHETMPSALFVVGNSSRNIRSGDAFDTDKDKLIAKAVFGNGPKDRKILGEGVYKHYGYGEDGFNISSCQFAMHYFFDKHTNLHQFVTNLAECTVLGGHFIGTCYDGKEVFKLLKNKAKDDSIVINKNGKKIYEIVKKYEHTSFSDDETSLGYAIDVFQETINKMFTEYLVNFEYFQRLMENYGFVLITKEEARHMGLPNSTGLFGELYDFMTNEIKRNPMKANDYGKAPDMSSEEKTISFLNRYFVFKKVTTVNTNIVNKILEKYEGKMEKIKEELDENTEDYMVVAEKSVKENEKKEEAINDAEKKVPLRKKLKNPKVVLEKFEPVVVVDQIVKLKKPVKRVIQKKEEEKKEEEKKEEEKKEDK